MTVIAFAVIDGAAELTRCLHARWPGFSSCAFHVLGRESPRIRPAESVLWERTLRSSPPRIVSTAAASPPRPRNLGQVGMPRNPRDVFIRLQPLPDRALELEPARSSAWLASLRPSDPSVVEEPERILAAEARIDDEGFLDDL